MIETNIDYFELIIKILKVVVPLIIIAMIPMGIMMFYNKSLGKYENKQKLDIPVDVKKKAVFILSVVFCVGLVIFGTFAFTTMPKNNAELFMNIFGGVIDNILSDFGNGPIGKLFHQFSNM